MCVGIFFEITTKPNRSSPRRRADGTLPRHFAGSESGDRHQAEHVLKLGGAVVSVLDRSGREDVRLHQPNASVVDLQGYVDHTLPSLLCITMILPVRRNFLKLLRSPTPPVTICLRRTVRDPLPEIRRF